MALLEASFGGEYFPLPTPKPGGYFPSYTHLENSYRDANGYLHRDIIRRNTAKVSCSFNALNDEQIATLQQLYDYDYFWLRYTDNYGKRVTKKMYAGPMNGKVSSINHSSLIPTVLTDVSMNFVEF